MSDARLAPLRQALTASGPGEVQFVRAPGRVNLIGDHTDYQDGLCLPMAIDRDVLVAFRARTDDRIVVRSLDYDEHAGAPWTRTVAEIRSALEARGARVPGFDAAVASTVPIGSGLSSSAAFEIAIAHVAASRAQFGIGGRDLARVAQEAEQRASGVPCGVMDQMASVFGSAGHALFLDCRTLEFERVEVPPHFALVAVHSGLPRTLDTSAYAERRRACEAAAARLGVPALRDATPAQVVDDPLARHVVTENRRVHDFVAALGARDGRECGRLMLESHASLRDDFAVSTPELDLLVDLAIRRGAYGARLTGAGFGGCIIALLPADAAEDVGNEVGERYVAATGLEPTVFRVRASDGAGPITPVS